MASRATERINRIMTKLMMEGKLDKPFYPNGQRTPQSKVAHKHTEKATNFFVQVVNVKQLPTESDDCCVGSLSRLPDGVVCCPDCPLDSVRSTV